MGLYLACDVIIQPDSLSSRKHAHSYDNRKATMTRTSFLTEHLAVHPYAKLDVSELPTGLLSIQKTCTQV